MAKSLNFKIRQANKETLESSSVHAIPNIIRNRLYPVKIMWVICFFGSSIGCAIFIKDSISDYLNYDVITNIKIDYVNKLKFPMITICNANTQKTKNVSNMLNDTIIYCRFNFFPCDIENDFEYYNDSTYNYCFRFNSGKNMRGSPVETKFAYGKGKMNEFHLVLYDDSSIAEESDYKGFVFFLSDEIVDIVNDLDIYLSSGILTKLSISKYKVIKKPKPYSNCLDDLTNMNSYHSICYKKTFSIDKKYKFSDCSNMCLQKFIGDNCDIQLAQLGKSYYGEKRIISDSKKTNQSTCAFLNIANFKNSNEHLDKCDCPLECVSSGYTHTSSFFEHPTTSYAHSLLNKSPLLNKLYANKSLMNLKNELYSLKVHFEDMKETIIKDEIKTRVSDLISSLGGTLGLFLGLSFLSFVEIFEIVFQSIVIFFDNHLKKPSESDESVNVKNDSTNI